MLWSLAFSILVSLASPQAFAVLGGRSPKVAHPEIFEIDVRFSGQSRICTATAISPSALLTAAHCFDHVEDSQIQNFEIYVNKQPEKIGFQLQRHPNYTSREDAKDYFHHSNFDVAVLQFESSRFANFKQLRFEPQPPSWNGLFLGIGMKQLVWSYDSGLQEQERGRLQETSIAISETNKGILSSKASLLHLEKSRRLTPVDGSGQILRSDSGGPLMAGGFVVGIARNYSLQAARQSFKTAGHRVHLASQFTSLSHTEISTFLKRYL